jgi:hypothetical protein
VILAEVWYQNPLVVVAAFAFITTGLARLAKKRDDRLARAQKLEDEKARIVEKHEDEQLRIDKEKRDNARADTVAAQVAEAARLAAEAAVEVKHVATAASEAAALLVESNHRVQRRQDETNERLTNVAAATTELTRQNAQIMVSTDGALTAAMRATLAATEASLAAQKAMVAMRAEKGGVATPESLASITADEAQAAALRIEIEVRSHALQTAIANLTDTSPPKIDTSPPKEPS